VWGGDSTAKKSSVEFEKGGGGGCPPSSAANSVSSTRCRGRKARPALPEREGRVDFGGKKGGKRSSGTSVRERALLHDLYARNAEGVKDIGGGLGRQEKKNIFAGGKKNLMGGGWKGGEKKRTKEKGILFSSKDRG